eukprot:1100742_1
MAGLWKGLKGIVRKDSRASDFDYSVFSKEMTLKMVFVGGHQSGKTSIVRILNRKKFSTEYDPTIGIDQHKIRLENTESKESLWLWDVSHAELGGVHESLIFHQAHGIILVADLTNFTNIQAIDQWMHSISVYLKRLDESQHTVNTTNRKDTNKDEEAKSDDIITNKRHKKRNKNSFIPRLYLLISKYDLSAEPILTDTQLHKFCKSNSIRAFARISAKLDRRSEMLDIFSKFSEDIVSHLPSKTTYHHASQEENDRFRYNYAIKRLQRNKINRHYHEDTDKTDTRSNTVFDLRVHGIKTFKWMYCTQMTDDAMNDDTDPQESSKSDDNTKKNTDRRMIAQNGLHKTEQEAKRVLIGMREAVKLQKNKTLRDAREYQKNLLKLKAMNQAAAQKEYECEYEEDEKNQSKIIGTDKAKNMKETLLEYDVITSLKLDMINGLQQEIEDLTQIWEDELNTIAELIRFQIPLQRTNANLKRLSQQIIAREMLFRRRIRLVSELRTQNRMNVSQMMMMQEQQKGKEKGKDIERIHNAHEPSESNVHDHNINQKHRKNALFSDAMPQIQTIEALP